MVVGRRRWIPAHRRDELKALASRSRQVVLAAAITGVVTGLVVAGFEWVVVDVLFDHVSELPLWLVAIAPAAGLLVSLLARRFIGRSSSPATADEYLHAFHDRRFRMGSRDYAARVTASVATLGTGAPMGLEGMSIYSGVFAGSALQRRLTRTFRDADRRVLLVAGAAAGVAAIFKAPATGAVFALEVPYHDDLARRMLLPALVASATSYIVFVACFGTAPLFPISGQIDFSLRDVAGAVLTGLIAGLGARGFAWLVRRAKALYGRIHPLTGALGAGAVIAVLFVAGRLITGESLVVGAGYHVVEWAAEPGRSVWVLMAVLAMRCVATSAAVAGGGVGGLFIPLVVAGALTGSMVAGVVASADLTLFIVIGVAVFLGAGYRVPLAAVMFVAETTGRPSFVVPGLLAAVAAELLMGRSSVSSYQRTSDHPAAGSDAGG